MKTKLSLIVAAALISLGTSAHAESNCCAKKAAADCCERQHSRAIFGFNGGGNPIRFRMVAHHSCAQHAKAKSSCCPAKAKDAKHCNAARSTCKTSEMTCAKPAAAKCAKPTGDCCAK